MRYIIKGINEDESVCELCGKINLKRVVWLEDVETGHLTHVGTSCASKLRGLTVKDQKNDEKGFLADELERLRNEILPILKPLSQKSNEIRQKALDTAPEGKGLKVRRDHIRNYTHSIDTELRTLVEKLSIEYPTVIIRTYPTISIRYK